MESNKGFFLVAQLILKLQSLRGESSPVFRFSFGWNFKDFVVLNSTLLTCGFVIQFEQRMFFVYIKNLSDVKAVMQNSRQGFHILKLPEICSRSKRKG